MVASSAGLGAGALAVGGGALGGGALAGGALAVGSSFIPGKGGENEASSTSRPQGFFPTESAILLEKNIVAALDNIFASRRANDRVREAFGQISPLRGALSTLVQRIFSGEFATDPGAVPFINRSREDTRIAGARSLRETEDRLASTGLAGTPFGERIHAGTIQEGALAEARVPTDIAEIILKLAPQLFASTDPSNLVRSQLIPFAPIPGGGQASDSVGADQSAQDTQATSSALLNFAQLGGMFAGGT